jgi:glycosyltransferase involved in cell wall biosynthesis
LQNKNKLAIIIPAYKSFYLEQTLHSFANQTNKNFKIYIGDDNSPEDIESIVLKFKDILDIKYHKFKENLGSKSLTKHWERCIALSTEDWIWLFSDDDIVDENCVEKFYKSLDDSSQLYKFQTKIIDSNNNRIAGKYDKINSFTNSISSNEFITNRLSCKGFRSFAVEYVFARDLFLKHKFVDFPLAWASDDATWFNYSLKQGNIKCIPAFVSWRASNLNISTSRKNKEINKKKIQASKEYCIWLKGTAKNNKISISDKAILYWFSIQIASIEFKINYNTYKVFIKQLGLNVKTFITLKYYLIIKYYHIRNRFQ